MPRTTITLPGSLVEELMTEVKAKSKTEAVIKAIKDEIRTKKKKKIKNMAGKMEFTTSASELRHRDRRIG
jgi:metal-responsive CopG/Arc/MetJ family transcriptional regulator